ncbi:MAG: hypothetical protein NTV44_02340 [Firmicutes bacterium]|nr:hypothetical protein [Bacillota bacterium]
MNYPKWPGVTELHDPSTPFSILYRTLEGGLFYIEPAFYTQLSGFQMHHPNKYQLILDEMARLVKVHKRVIFTADDEHPIIHKGDFVLLEITDVTNPLKIFIQDKNTGSNYGD